MLIFMRHFPTCYLRYRTLTRGDVSDALYLRKQGPWRLELGVIVHMRHQDQTSRITKSQMSQLSNLKMLVVVSK